MKSCSHIGTLGTSGDTQHALISIAENEFTSIKALVLRNITTEYSTKS